MPLKSTHLIFFHSKSTHYKIIPFFSTHLPKHLLSESLFGVNVLVTWRHKLEITLAHLSPPPTHHITLTTPCNSSHPQNITLPTPCDSSHPQNITPGNSSHSYYHQQYRAIQEEHQRNNANKEGAKKGNRMTPKEVLCGNFGHCSKEGSCHHRTTPPTKEGQTTRLLPETQCVCDILTVKKTRVTN